MLAAERAKSAANWTIVDYPTTTVYLIMSLHGCNDTSASLTIPCTLVGSGINDISGLSNLSLQPNPADGALNISYQLANETELQISIMDMQGRKLIPVLNEKKSGGIYNQQVNVSSLASGVYMVNFESSEGRVVRRFVRE
jgi:hypothetical protein